jgi:hypothetical protein
LDEYRQGCAVKLAAFGHHHPKFLLFSDGVSPEGGTACAQHDAGHEQPHVGMHAGGTGIQGRRDKPGDDGGV